jgi:hypothetical protein
MSDIFGIGAIGSATIGAIAANRASDLQYQSTQSAIAQQKAQFDQTQANEQPWLTAGKGALDQLTAGTAPGGSLVTPFGETYTQPAAFDGGPAFTAPTLDNTNDPGYAFRLQQGEQAIERGASAAGGANSGGTLKAIARYGQDYASNEYANVYNRALQGYQTNFSDKLNSYNTNVATGLQGYQTRFNAYNTNQGNTFNRLSSIAGTGQTAVGQLATAGQANANTISDLTTQGGNARAAGVIGTSNAITGGINSLANNYNSGGILAQLTGRSGGGNTNGGYVGYEAPSNGYYSQNTDYGGDEG